MTAGIATLREVRKRGFYQKLDETSARLQTGLHQVAKENQLSLQLNRVGSMLGLFFTNESVIDYGKARASDTVTYNLVFKCMLEQGIYLPPSPFETIFISAAHNQRDIEKTVAAAAVAFQQLNKSRSP
jgi:glutamate-1-semialdehyde 2,1-aminomutase